MQARKPGGVMQIEGVKKITSSVIGATDLPTLKKGVFIDRSEFIAKVIRDQCVVRIFTRPRRFMKTSNLHLLYTFYSPMVNGIKTANYFDGMEVCNMNDDNGDNIYQTYQGKYPCIWLSLGNMDKLNYEQLYQEFTLRISSLYLTVLAGAGLKKLDKITKALVMTIINRTADEAVFTDSLYLLIKILYEQNNNQRVIVFIDEYDNPLSNTYCTEDPSMNEKEAEKAKELYLNKAINLFKTFFNKALKDNTMLSRAFLTGILKISSDTLFSGLNNMQSSSLLYPQGYEAYFGFTEPEVAFLRNEALGPEGEGAPSMEELKSWYNGYLINNVEIYNPWAIISALAGRDTTLRKHWTLTATDRIMKTLTKDLMQAQTAQFRELMESDITIELSDEFSFDKKWTTANSIYALLWFSGYLKPVEGTQIEGDYMLKLNVKLVNREIYTYFKDTVVKFFEETYKFDTNDWMSCLEALTHDQPDIELFANSLKENILIKYVSFRDGMAPKMSPAIVDDPDIIIYENFYQGLMLGFFINMSSAYNVSSNNESGLGYPDYLLKPTNKAKWAFIVELKRVKAEKDLTSECDKGMKQIKAKRYEVELKKDGYTKIKAISLCFHFKEIAYNSADL